jgi:hypothetical protein
VKNILHNPNCSLAPQTRERPAPFQCVIQLTLALCALVFASRALCQENTPRVWINPGMYSYHFDRSAHYRENNIGFGAEAIIAKDHGVMAGTFINSDRARSRYAAYQWRPLHWQPFENIGVSAGLLLGAFDGYPRMRDGGWFVAPLPLLAVEGKRLGANFTIVPNYGNRLHGAVSVQIKLRVW